MSFATEVKREAAALPMKKTCCRRALIAGALLGGAIGCDDAGSQKLIELP